MSKQLTAKLYLIGPPQVKTASGERLHIRSKKAIALLAMLATSSRFERSRVWLQEMLWGSRAQKQAQSSLRRELSTLRSIFVKHGLDLIHSDRRTITLKGDNIYIDYLDPNQHSSRDQFCEGLDLANEEGFEDWLREMRIDIEDRANILPKHTAVAHTQIITPLKSQLAILATTSAEKSAEAFALAQQVDNIFSNYAAGLRWLPIVANNPNLEEGMQPPTSEAISEELGVRYIVRSEIIEVNGRFSINFALLEMPGRIIRWTETRSIKGYMCEHELNAEIARAINCICATFDICEQRHCQTEDLNDTGDIDQIAWWIRFHINRFTSKSLDDAGKLLDKALLRFPKHCELMMLRANLSLWRYWVERSSNESTAYLAPLVRTAMRADPSDARGSFFQGIIDTWNKRGQAAKQQLENACQLCPCFAQAFVHLGSAHYLSDDPQSAIKPLKHALFMAPLDPMRFYALGELATAYWMLGRYDDAIEITSKIQVSHPGYILAHVIETASNHAAGRPDDAARSRAKLLNKEPQLHHTMLDWIPFENDHWKNKLQEACY